MPERNEDQEVRCSACKEEIKLGAVKCPHCGTDQNYLHRFRTTATVVGSVLAVLSLSALGWSAAVEILGSKMATLVGSVAASDDSGIYFSVSNHGSRPATIFDVVEEGPYTNDMCKRKVTYGARMHTASVLKVVKPGKTYAFVAKAEDGLSYLPSTFAPDALTNPKIHKGLKKFRQCKLAISYIDFDNKKKEFNIPYYCAPQAPCLPEKSSTKAWSRRVNARGSCLPLGANIGSNITQFTYRIRSRELVF